MLLVAQILSVLFFVALLTYRFSHPPLMDRRGNLVFRRFCCIRPVRTMTVGGFACEAQATAFFAVADYRRARRAGVYKPNGTERVMDAFERQVIQPIVLPQRAFFYSPVASTVPEMYEAVFENGGGAVSSMESASGNATDLAEGHEDALLASYGVSLEKLILLPTPQSEGVVELHRMRSRGA